MNMITVTVNANPIVTTISKIADAVEATGDEPMKGALLAAASLALAWNRDRFETLSRGGGEWPDLAYSTKLKRARALNPATGKPTVRRKTFDKAVAKLIAKGNSAAAARRSIIAGMKFAILRDTSTLFNSLSQGAPGSIHEEFPGGVRVGTSIFYAAFHQNPTIPGRPPQRKIIVVPDQPTIDRMNQVYADGIKAATKKAVADGTG